MRSGELKKQVKNTCESGCSVLMKYIYTHGESINSKNLWPGGILSFMLVSFTALFPEQRSFSSCQSDPIN